MEWIYFLFHHWKWSICNNPFWSIQNYSFKMSHFDWFRNHHFWSIRKYYLEMKNFEKFHWNEFWFMFELILVLISENDPWKWSICQFKEIIYFSTLANDPFFDSENDPVKWTSMIFTLIHFWTTMILTLIHFWTSLILTLIHFSIPKMIQLNELLLFEPKSSYSRRPTECHLQLSWVIL